MMIAHHTTMGSLAGINARLRAASAPLYWLGLALLLASLPTLGLALWDVRQFHGVSVWLKPFKFQISIGTYLLTLALFMSWLPAAALRSRAVAYVVWVAVASGLFEVGYITWQGALGLASHFNYSTPLYALMYMLMGLGAVALTSASLVLGVVVARSSGYGQPPAIKQAVVIGLVLTFVLGTGFGAYLSSQPGGHWVGGALTDSGGLPVFQWSRSGGDLRVAHFFGIHAMHFVPAFALALGLVRVPQALAIRAVWLFAAVFSAFSIWTFLQARGGQAFLP
jgi:hypothetical protein